MRTALLQDQQANCGAHATCVNVLSSHICVCDMSYVLKKGKGCIPMANVDDDDSEDRCTGFALLGVARVSARAVCSLSACACRTHTASTGTHTFARTLVLPQGGKTRHILGGTAYRTFRLHLHLQSGATDVYAIYGTGKDKN